MKTWFDRKLYKEGLRQLRVPGIVCSGILGIISILVLLIIQMDRSNYVDILQNIDTRMIYGFNPILYLIPYGLPVLMILKLFRFQNQRNGSDFYHSIPHTRICLGISYLAAALTWILGILWGCSLFTGLFAQLLPATDVLWGESIRFLFHSTTASLLAGAGVFLAASVTGTLFTNLAASAMILCMPVLIELVIELNVKGRVDYIYSLHNIFPYMYNTLFNYMICAVSDGFMGYRFGNTGTIHLLGSCLYTTCLAAVLYVAGLILFHKRKSESAGQPASGRKTRALFRVLPAFAITLIPVSVIYQGEAHDGVDWMWIVALYVFAVILYLLYELFSTGKWKSALQSLKGIWLLVVLNIATLLVLAGITSYVQHDIPSAKQIDSVSVLEWYGYGYGYSYFDNQIQDIRFSGEEWSEFASEALQETVVRDQEIEEYWNNTENWEYQSELFDFTRQPVVIRAGHKTLYRYLYLTDAQQQKMEQMMKDNEAFRNTYMTLPDFKGGSVWIRNNEDIAVGDAQAFRDTFQQEIEAAGFEKWYAYLAHEGNGWFNVIFTDAENTERVYMPVSRMLTPKTYQTCIQYLTEHSTSELEPSQKTALTKLTQGKVDNADLYIQLVDLKADMVQIDQWVDYHSNVYEDELVYYEGEIDPVAFAALLSEIMKEGADETSGYLLMVSGDIYEPQQGDTELNLAIYLSDAQAEKLITLYRESGGDLIEYGE